MTDPFLESPEHVEANKRIQQEMKIFPAILANGDPGLAVKIGALTTCINTRAAIKLATMIVNTIDKQESIA